MNNRTKTILGAVAEIITGPFGSMLHQSDYTLTGTQVIMPQDIGNRTLDKTAIAHVGSDDTERLARYKVRENDIVYARRGDVEKHAFIGKDDEGSLCGTGCMRVRVDAQKANPMYISFYLNRPESKRWISQHAVGSNMPNLNTQILNEVPLELPSMDEQVRTIAVLNDIDSLIQSNESICYELESMAKTLYDYWFTQFDFPSAEGKPYRSSGGAMEWNDQLKREIPKGWDVRPLSYVISSINTGLNPRDNFVLGNGDIQYLTVKNLTTSGTIDFSGCDTIDEDARSIIHKRSDISVGDILFASIAPLGRCYLIQSNPQNWDINESVFSIRRNASRVTSEFLYMYFMSDTFIKGATSSSTGSIFKGIRINTLLDIVAVIPPKDVVNDFTARITKLLALKEQKASENHELTKLRDWLLPMLMNGQATVAPASSENVVQFPEQPEVVEVLQAARSFSDSQPTFDDTADLIRYFKEHKS